MISLQKSVSEPADILLRNDILVEICSYLSPTDIAHLQRANKKFNAFFKSNKAIMQLIWKSLLERDFPQFHDRCVNDIFVRNAKKLKNINLENMNGISEVYQAYVAKGYQFDFQEMYIEIYKHTFKQEFPSQTKRQKIERNTLIIQAYYACVTNDYIKFKMLLQSIKSPKELEKMLIHNSQDFKRESTLTLFTKAEPWLPDVYKKAIDLFSMNPLEVCQQSGLGLVHWAAICGMSSEFATLKKKGHDLELESETGLTPLLFAAWRNDLVSVKKLIELEPNPIYESETTVLGAAVYHLNIEMVKLLIEKGILEISCVELDCIWDHVDIAPMISSKDAKPLDDTNFTALAEIFPPLSFDERIFPIIKILLENSEVSIHLKTLLLNTAIRKARISFDPQRMIPLIRWLMEYLPKGQSKDELGDEDKLSPPANSPRLLISMLRSGGCSFGIDDTFAELTEEPTELLNNMKKLRNIVLFYSVIQGKSYFLEQLNQLLELWKEDFTSQNKAFKDKLFLEYFESQYTNIKANYLLLTKQDRLNDFFIAFDKQIFEMVLYHEKISELLLEQISFLVTEIIAPKVLVSQLLKVYNNRENTIITNHKLDSEPQLFFVRKIQFELTNILNDRKAYQNFKENYLSDSIDLSRKFTVRLSA